ncbi:hypothetical protein NDA14_001716 [Ustilago hordei]|nr:hypothetical protein NDA14_001716 [Ustilago hordei]
MSTSIQARRHSRGVPQPSFESYDLAQSSRSRASYRREDDLFDTLFPQPPPRSRIQAERLARPSLPSLKASLQVDSADSSSSTAQLLSSSNSIESVNWLASNPSSTSSLSLLHSIRPSKQGSTDSSIDYYSPAVSDVNSAETDHSLSSSHAHSQSSELDPHEHGAPLTPLTPNGASHPWRPKQLNLLRKRQVAAPAESCIPAYQATPSWNATPTISADRNALLIGLGLAGIALSSSPAAPSATSALSNETLMQASQTRALMRSRSPQLGSSASSSRDSQAANAPLPQGPKQLLLVSSGGPPGIRRFPGRRPSEGLFETFTSPIPAPASEQSSRSNTPQMRSAIPVMPSGPAFVDARACSPDLSSLAHGEQQTGLSAKQFLAQIASTPEYQASQYFESTTASSAWPSGPAEMQLDPKDSDQDFDKPLYTAMSTVADHHFDMSASEYRTTDSAATNSSAAFNSSATASPALSLLAAKGPGFCSEHRSTSASLSRRKAPPTPLVLTSSPATSNSDTLPGSASGRRRRSLTATINSHSPLSAPHSNRSSTWAPSPGKTPTSAESGTGSSSVSGSDRRQHRSDSDYSEPLRTAFYDFDPEDDGEVKDDTASKPSSNLLLGSAHASAALRMICAVSTWTEPETTPSAPQETEPVFDRKASESQDSQLSALSSHINSLRSTAETRESTGSEPAAAFEFADLETKPSSEGLSLQTMMGFLQRQDSQKAPTSSLVQDVDSESDEQESDLYPAAESTVHQASTLAAASSQYAASSSAEARDKAALVTMPTPAPSGVPSFNISIFGPGQTTEAKHAPPQLSIDPKYSAEAAHGPVLTRSRKQSMVPAPPSFAIRDASGETQQNDQTPVFVPFEIATAVAGAESNELPAGNSRWSSGSESDGESAISTKATGRKSFSKGRKSFSASRKNSVAINKEPIAAPLVAKEVTPEAGGRQSKQSSKSQLSAQGAAPQNLSVPTKSSATSISKRLLLNGLPSLRKKSFSNLSSQSASPSTPSSAGPAFFNRTELPFPPPATPQALRSPPVPSITSQPLDGHDTAGLTIRTASVTTFASAAQLPGQSPQTPVSAPNFASSNGATGPLTTQQILAQARNNVWPENYIGTSVSAAGMSSPYLSAAHDAFSHDFAPSRLAPTPPYFATSSTTRIERSSTPHPPPMSQSPRLDSNRTSRDKSLPSTPLDGPAAMIRSRSRHNEFVPPPKNLRHLRQSSSNTNLDKLRKDVPADVFRYHQKREASALDAAETEARVTTAGPSPQQDMVGTEEKLATVTETNVDLVSALSDSSAPIDTVLDASLDLPPLVERRQAKSHKARRIRKQGDRFPRYNSWSDFGLQWVAEQSTDAFDILAAELLPAKAILIAAGASTGNSNRLVTGGSGGGGGDGDSDESDTDDYGSSDGGGGAGGGGGFGGAGGGGGGKQPASGRNDADNSDDDLDEESEDDEVAEVMTDNDSDEPYEDSEQAAASRVAHGAKMPTVPARGASTPTSHAQAEEVDNSDSSDDRPLGLLVDDPRALQKVLRAQERKRHFALAAQALEGKGSSGATLLTGSQARHAGQSQSSDAVVNPSDLAQRLAKVQGRRERAQTPNAAVMQRSQTVARQDVSRALDRKKQPDAAAASRSKSVRATPADRYVHPGMRARTPSEAALRAKAMAQAVPHGPSPISPTLPSVAKMPELPSNAMATVVAAQKAMAHAQANPSPAALAQAQALATSATAALNAATAQVKRAGSSPISPSFNQGEPIGHISTSPRIADGVEPPGARLRAGSKAHAFPVASPGGAGAAAPAVAITQHPSMLQRLRSRSISRNQAPLTINTAAAPPMPDMPRPSTASKDSQASSSPHSAHTQTFAALSQAAINHGRPSVDAAAAPSEGHGSQMSRAASNHPGNLSNSNDSSTVPAEPRQPHKIFILSRQRFTVVEVPVSARARDLALEVIERERLPMDDSKGGWVVFDCSSQLGAERPLREYEVITDVVNVRAHPQTDFFLIKRTELSTYLSIRSLPSSSPALAGYVYVQDRKKKWSKRWLELRDHALYHAKNEKGKDEMSVCQISTFDVYLVDSSAFKMPKANGFALRSQDPITMFEKPDQDYIHYFCLTDPAAHRDWVRAILNARTYILRQEKAVLFQIDSPPTSHEAGQPGVLASGGLSRKNTSRRPNGRPAASSTEAGTSGATGPSPPTPLIDSNAFAGPFAKGSLLADKAISDAKEALRGHAAVAPPTGALHDLSLMDRNAVRMNEARRKEEIIERQRRMKADGQPLIDLARR